MHALATLLQSFLFLCLITVYIDYEKMSRKLSNKIKQYLLDKLRKLLIDRIDIRYQR